MTGSSTKCLRAGCGEEVDRSHDVWPYCTKLCAAIDRDGPPCGIPAGVYAVKDIPYVPTGDTEPLPPPRGLSAITFTEEEVRALLANEPVLPTDSDERKEIPLFSGFLNYFPLACVAVARVSKRGNDKHNPGEPLGWARGKSTDHTDCIARHLLDIETLNADGEYEDAACLAWRAMAKLQELEEKRLGKPPSRGSR